MSSFRIYKSHIFRPPLTCGLLPRKGIIVEPSPIQRVDAKHPLYRYLGFNHISIYLTFLCFRNISRLSLFHLCVVVEIALGIQSN
nr:MAG TPA_asm: hypothetical protein [Caudoviricetes sp.]